MHRPRSRVARLQIALDHERHVALGDLKNGILTLLGIWIAYFLVINFFVQTLDKITVPFVDMPLGQMLVMQGSVIIFFCALTLLIRRQRQQ